MPQLLRPTVKRDLSAFSIFSWKSGYTRYLRKDLGFWYDIFFHYDGEKVNFYHRLSDFEYFKKVITPKLMADQKLFVALNNNFQTNVLKLKKILSNLKSKDLPKASNLIGKIMSLYIFIVSDDFVRQIPEAWESRNMSEGILYEADKKVEEVLHKLLKDLNIPTKLKHFLTPLEVKYLIQRHKLGVTEIQDRIKSHIIFKRKIITKKTFEEFCIENDLENPENKKTEHKKEITGKTAYAGKVGGHVKIIKKIEDIKK